MLLTEQLMLNSIKNPNEKTSGIYMLYCVITKKAYIGQSRNMHRRYIDHRSTLNSETLSRIKCANPNLKKDWQSYGKRFFIFAILEYCEKELLSLRETYYTNLIDKEHLYNCLDNWKGRKHREESKRKMSTSLKGKKISPTAIENRKRKGAIAPPRAKLTAGQAFDIKLRLLRSEDVLDIAKIHNIHHCTIKDIRDGRSWKYISHKDGSCIYPEEDNFNLALELL